MASIRTFIITLVLAAVVLPSSLEARNEKGDWEIGVHLGRTRFFDSDVLDDHGFWGVNLGYSINEIFELAVNYDVVSTSGEDQIEDADLDFLTVDFIFNGGKDAHRPFFLVGVGIVDEDIVVSTPSGEVRTSIDSEVLDVGLGYRGYFTHKTGIRIDARLYFTDEDGDGFGLDDKDLRVSYGLVFNLKP